MQEGGSKVRLGPKAPASQTWAFRGSEDVGRTMHWVAEVKGEMHVLTHMHGKAGAGV